VRRCFRPVLAEHREQSGVIVGFSDGTVMTPAAKAPTATSSRAKEITPEFRRRRRERDHAETSAPRNSISS
jgi:hypothetical protein